MSLIHFATALALVLVNLAALTAVGSRLMPAPIARVAGLLAISLPLFAIEHFVGLGSLHWVWLITTAISLYVLLRAAPPSAESWRAESVFVLCVAYALLWRWVDPNIDPQGEGITDLYFIANYLGGNTLPPPDQWLGGRQPFDFYYGFQHYAAALMGRVFTLSPGLTLNLAGPLTIGLLGSLAWFVAAQWIRPWWGRLLLVATLLVGGNGLSPWLLAAIDRPADTPQQRAEAGAEQLWAMTRFSGIYEDRVNTEAGERWLIAPMRADSQRMAMDLPLETPAYLLLLGDFHPPLGGWVLLMLALALMSWIDTAGRGIGQARGPPSAVALLAATPVITLVTNTWVFPLQAALVGLWFAFCALRRELDWRAAFAGVAGALALVFPFLGHFAPQALSPAIELVPDAMHTRWAVWLALHWPEVVLLGLAVLCGFFARGARPPHLWMITGFIAVALLLSEFFFFDDPNGGKYERFNTVLKFWSWIWPLALIGLAPQVWGAGGRLVRAVIVVVCVALLLNLWNVGRYLWNAEPVGAHRLAGDGWLRVDAAQDELLRRLAAAPAGVVLERPEGGAYDAASAFALFAGKPAALGWPQHQEGWLGGSRFIAGEAEGVRQFFAGANPDPLEWLLARDVRYVVWSRRDERALPAMRARIDAAIGARYEFRSIEVRGDQRIGYWERRP